MNIKIQGGESGKYSNSGSSSNLVDYLEHEDLERMKEGKQVEYFFLMTRIEFLQLKLLNRLITINKN
jgi:hypothetical protein